MILIKKTVSLPWTCVYMEPEQSARAGSLYSRNMVDKFVMSEIFTGECLQDW